MSRKNHKLSIVAAIIMAISLIFMLLVGSCTSYSVKSSSSNDSNISSSSSHSSSSSNSGSSKSYSSGKVTGPGAGGYDMPKEGESFSEYVERVDPDLYDSLFDGLYDD